MAVRSTLGAGLNLPPVRFLVLITVRDWVDPRAIVRLEELGQLKNPVTLPGIQPATFRLVAWCFKQLKLNSVVLVHKRTIPIERRPNLRIDGAAWSAQRISTAVNLGFLDPGFKQLHWHMLVMQDHFESV
jgi:hypothetical protein